MRDVDAAMVKAFSPPDGFLLFLEQQKKTMGDDYPLLAFTDPEKAAMRDKMLAGMKVRRSQRQPAVASGHC